MKKDKKILPFPVKTQNGGIRVKNGDIYSCRDALQRLLAHDDIPVKQAYWIAKFARKMSEEIALVEGQRVALIRKYGVENDGQVTVEQNGENWVKFVQEHNELMDMETDLDVRTVQIPDNVAIPIGDLMALDMFIEIATV